MVLTPALEGVRTIRGAERSFIEPGSPWQNPFVESFGSRVRDELLSVETFDPATAGELPPPSPLR